MDTVEETRTNLYVNNIPRDATHNDVLAVFQKFGKVVRFTLPATGDGKGILGYAYVQYDKSWKAEEALRSECSLRGQHFHMEWAEEQPEGSQKRFRSKARALNDKGKTLAIKKVPAEATAEEVQELFSKYVKCVARRPEHKNWMAFVDFKNNQEAKMALDLCNDGEIKIGGRAVTAEWAKHDTKKWKKEKAEIAGKRKRE